MNTLLLLHIIFNSHIYFVNFYILNRIKWSSHITTRKTSSYNCFSLLPCMWIFRWLWRSRVIKRDNNWGTLTRTRNTIVLQCLLKCKRNNSFNIHYCCWKQIQAMVWLNRQLSIDVKQECQSSFNNYFVKIIMVNIVWKVFTLYF